MSSSKLELRPETAQADKVRVVQLRDPWLRLKRKRWLENAVPEAGPTNSQLLRLRQNELAGPQEVLTILLEEFVAAFAEVHLCHHLPTGGVFFVERTLSSKRGIVVECDVEAQGAHHFELVLQGEPSCSVSLLVFATQGGFSLLEGALDRRGRVLVSAELKPGRHLLFAKLPEDSVERKAALAVNGPGICWLKDSAEQPSRVLKQGFLSFAREHVSALFPEKMWLSVVSLARKNGYAFIALGCQPGAAHRFEFSFREQSALRLREFAALGFRLKKGHKGVSESQRVLVRPGEEFILLMRWKGATGPEVSFPPPLDLKVVLEGQ